jgi:hypothetical protein
MKNGPNEKGALAGITGTLSAVLVRVDGTHRDYGIVSDDKTHRLIGRPIQWWRLLWNTMKKLHMVPNTMGFAVFLKEYGIVDKPEDMLRLFKMPRVLDIIMGREDPLSKQIGLVTTGGINFLATDFAVAQSSPRIGAMRYHDVGTSSTAANSTQTGLVTPVGGPRSGGTGANPTTNQYKSTCTPPFATPVTITEWGLFSASTAGTMWDRRVFTGIVCDTTDSITFTYTMTLTAGGT